VFLQSCSRDGGGSFLIQRAHVAGVGLLRDLWLTVGVNFRKRDEIVRRELFRTVAGNRTNAILQTGLSLLEGLSEALILTLFARIALSLVSIGEGGIAVPGLGDRPVSHVLSLVAGLIGIRLLGSVLNALIGARLQVSISSSLRIKSIRSYSSASWLGQASMDEGELQQMAVVLPNQISTALAGLITHVGQIVILLSMFSFAFFTDPKLTSIMILVVVVMTVLLTPVRRRIKFLSTLTLRQQSALSSGIAELSGLRTEGQAFGIMNKLAEPLASVVKKEARFRKRAIVSKGIVIPIYTSVSYSAVAFGLVVLWRSELESLSNMGPTLLVVLRSLSYGSAFQSAAASFASVQPAFHRLMEQQAGLLRASVEWGEESLGPISSIEFEGVSFWYPRSERPALRDVSLRLEPGSKIGLIGPSGGGKTTLVRLLLGLCEPSRGLVSINGTAVREFSRDSWSRKVGVVPQFPQVLRGSVSFNVRLFRDEISDEDVWRALEVADLAGEVRALPNSLETELGPGGWSLSGGQQQRLAIARAVAGRPQLVVMDEPTSSIDMLSESAVSDAIDRISAETTVVIVSHRMGILRGCQQLVVLEGGVVMANGAPDEVMRTSPYLRSIGRT